MILFSHKFGQLGNRLFAFAHLIANAAANNFTVVNLSFDEYAGYFHGSRGIICRYPNGSREITFPRLTSALFLLNRGILKVLRRLKIVKSPLHHVVVADLPEYKLGEFNYYELNSVTLQSMVKKKPIVFLFGRFFRDFSNFEKYQDIIREYFTPSYAIQEKIDGILKPIRENSDIIVGVHIRRGDYAEFMNGKYFYTQEQYADKMLALKKALATTKVTFVLCSNEPIENELFRGVDFIVCNGHPVEDLYTLAECDMIMGPPSTFSSWAAFYGNKPLCQISDINQILLPNNFVYLPKESFYNF